jgi:hypothetical protein
LCLPRPAAAFGFKELTVKRYRSVGPDVFAIDNDDSVKHLWQTDKSGKWGGSEALGGTAQDIEAVDLGNGRFEVFVVGTDGAIWHDVQRPNRKWGGWQSLGGEAKRLTVEKGKAGRFELFVIGNDDAVWHNSRKGPTGRFGGWERLGGEAKQLAAAASSRGMEIFVIGSDDAVWRSSNLGKDWESLGGEAKDIAVGRLPSGGLELFAIGSDNAVWHIRQDPAGSKWSEWESRGGEATRLSVSQSKQAGFELFVLGPDNAISRQAQTQPFVVWGEWKKVNEASPLDTTFAGLATMGIPEFKVSESRDVSLGIRFSVDRRDVQITSFPPIETKSFNTPFGSSKSTVTLIGGGSGTFDPNSGQIAIPITLHFDQSLDVPMVQEDADVSLELKTDAEGGSPLDRASGRITLAANAQFHGSGGVNPLRNKACSVVISGALDPLP